jgi:hypothetical protein
MPLPSGGQPPRENESGGWLASRSSFADDGWPAFAATPLRRGNLRLYSSAEVGDPAGTRTRDPVIKSHMLCQLSYRVTNGGARIRARG